MTYDLLDFFPDCYLPTCDQVGTVHSHILPHQQEILDWGYNSVPSFLYTQGGVGSAKTVAYAAKCVHECLVIPENEGVVVRKDYGLLFKSSWKAVKACIKKLVLKEVIEPPKYLIRKQGDYTCIEFFNGSIIYALQAKNLLEALGAGYGFFWVDDAMEVSEELFIGDETSGGLISRLRLPNVGAFKLGDKSNGLMGLASSNPPPIGHWLHKLFGREPAIYQIDPDDIEAGIVKVMQVATTDNPHVGVGYAKTLIAVQKRMGRGTSTIERLIEGKSLPAYGGIKVFPEFDHTKHVGKFPCDPDLPLVISIDFGFLHPGVTFSNLFKCEHHNTHFITLSEISELTSTNIWQLYSGTENHLGIKNHVVRYYSESSLLYYCGDKDGNKSSPNSKDKRSQIRILRDEYNITVKTLVLDLNSSLDYCRGLLDKTCPCGLSYILIDKSCEVLIGGLEGGYKYSKRRDGTISDKPFEDKFYADLCCSWRYGLENYVRHGLADSYIDNISNLRIPQKPTWDWMNMSVDELAKMLTK